MRAAPMTSAFTTDDHRGAYCVHRLVRAHSFMRRKKDEKSSCAFVASRYIECVINSDPNSQAARLLEVGDIVRNFGAIARVDLLTERGALLTIIPWTLNGVAQGGVGQRYYADPSKCEEVAR
jgi:hypothetical protein